MGVLMRKITKLLAPLYRLIRGQCRASTVLRVNDSMSIQKVQVETLSGEVSEIDRVQNYGFTSVPHANSKGVNVALGGNTNSYVAITIDDARYRLQGLENGEVALYDDQGQKVHFKRNGEIEIIANTRVVAKVPLFRIEGDLDVTGEITDRKDTTGQSMATMRSTYNSHTHTGDDGGSTSQPHQGMSS